LINVRSLAEQYDEAGIYDQFAMSNNTKPLMADCLSTLGLK